MKHIPGSSTGTEAPSAKVKPPAGFLCKGLAGKLKKAAAALVMAGLLLPSGPGGVFPGAGVQDVYAQGAYAQDGPARERYERYEDRESKRIMVYRSTEEGAVNPGLRLVVQLAPGTDPFAVAAAAGGQVERTGPFDFATLAFPDEAALERAMTVLPSHPGVLGVEHSAVYQAFAQTATSEPEIRDMYYEEQWALAVLEAPRVWAEGATGKGITVAVIDTGVAYDHPDLRSNTLPGYNAITGRVGYLAAYDDNGHGTKVAGVIAAGLNGLGIVGLAYEAKVLPVKTMSSAGLGTDDVIAAGIVWAVDNGARIINMSFGSGKQTAVLTEAIRYATDRGVLVIAASGNKGRDAAGPSGVSFPAADPEVLAVSATDYNDHVTSFSLTGPDLALCAPGYDILTTSWSSGRIGYAYADGTSIAAPHVAAAAAALWSKYPELAARDVRILLERSSKDLGDEGRDSLYGYGRISPYWALKFAAEPETHSGKGTLNWAGGAITAESSGGRAKLVVPSRAFGRDENDRISVAVTEVPDPPDFPQGIVSSSPAFSLQWGEQPPERMLSLTLDGEVPGNLTQPVAYVYRWSGSRWLRVGGGVEGGEVTVGIYSPGIYRLGFSERSGTSRIAGEDRIQTAVAVAHEAFPTGADTVILARADDFPDALAGAVLGYKYQAPILLTYPQVLPQETLAAIERLGAKRIYLLGGKEAISSGIESELRKIGTVKRLGGEDRYATAALIAAELGGFDRAVVVNGLNFPDALAAASLAAAQGMPILLTPEDRLALRTDQILRKKAATETLIVGGSGVVSRVTELLLPDPLRIGGANRYATAAEVIQAFPPAGRALYLATGLDFPDALTGGVLAAVNSTRILLVPSKPLPLDAQFLRAVQGKQALALGGVQAIPEQVLDHYRSQFSPGETEVITVSYIPSPQR